MIVSTAQNIKCITAKPKSTNLTGVVWTVVSTTRGRAVNLAGMERDTLVYKKATPAAQRHYESPSQAKK